MKKICIFFSSICMAIILNCAVALADDIICASTTSTENSGLFGHILPVFEKETGIHVKVVARGTGAALEMGRRGDADVVFVHAKEQELQAVAEGFFVERHDVMYNDFVIIGPADDPASIKGLTSAVEAFKKIADQKAVFISRGDQSGTHTKELAIWKQADINPPGQQWYLEVGQGMEKTQRIGNEKRAYVLTDRGTWLATRDQLEMEILLEGDPILFNQYGIMAVNPAKHSHVKYEQAMKFIRWMISQKGQSAIDGFRDKHGNPLFVPNAK
jgi:tungstate transport system substrate-binding protein